MTRRQVTYENDARDVCKLIELHARGRGYPPSLDEIARHLGYASRGSAHRLIARMLDEGILECEPRQPRTLRIKAAKMVAPIETL